MAQDDGKKDEEKFEFTPEGEALGYITLEQARLQAIQHARDNTGFYGPRYARVTLVWEVTSQEEGEDFYDIRLSFRPAGRFLGEPGVEQLIIDKTGNVQLRQILDEPSDLGRPTGRGPRRLFVAAVGLVVIGVAAVGALFGSGIIGGDPAPTSTPVPAAALAPTPTTVVERQVVVTATPGPTPTPRPATVPAPVASSTQTRAPSPTTLPPARVLPTPIPALTAVPPTSPPSPTPQTVIRVTKTADTDDGICDSDCSLREAIRASVSGYTVVIPAGIYTLTLGELDTIDKDLTLAGAGAEKTIIQAAEALHEARYGVIRIRGPAGASIPPDVTISAVTIRNGKGQEGGVTGGGITNIGNLTLENSVVTGNEAVESGGGVLNFGMLTLINSSVSENVAHRSGGGIYSSSGDDGTLTLISSTVRGNKVIGGRTAGGGIFVGGGALALTNSTVSENEAQRGGGLSGGVITLSNSTVSGNTANSDGAGTGGTGNGTGGGIHGDRPTLSNSTVSGNTATNDGGGIFSSGQLAVINSTIAENLAGGQGGGVYNEGGRANLVNTIIAGNTAPNGPDCSGKATSLTGRFTSLGHNLLGNAIGCDFTAGNGDQIGFQFAIDPKLGPLQDNGGLTETHALLEGSPAIDAGVDGSAPETDQRGISRPQGGSSDIGAFEF